MEVKSNFSKLLVIGMWCGTSAHRNRDTDPPFIKPTIKKLIPILLPFCYLLHTKFTVLRTEMLLRDLLFWVLYTVTSGVSKNRFWMT